MSLSSGTRLGAYEIVSVLGAGGMGEVYRARDTRLDRDVAVKVLPAVFASEPERLARFEREAKTLATLNHPNIAQIYGLEDRALVMELVPGVDLSTHIARGPLPIADALPIARQIAEALEAAHEAGIIHRDLKPANIKVKPDGTVKLLDFGLTKAFDAAQARAMDGSPLDPANSPTLIARATHMGMIIGTAAYMAPEQARGRDVDKRADIWSFGVVLYEMLTGRRLFKGDDLAETLASVIRDAPQFDALPASAPPRLRLLLERCLERDPKVRLRDIGEARVELAAIARGEVDVSLPPGAAERRAWWRSGPSLVAAAACGVLVTLGVIALMPGTGTDSATPPVAVRAALALPEGTRLHTYDRSIAISPDGTEVVVAASDRGSGKQTLHLRSLAKLEWKALAGTDEAIYPFWSPNGRAIGFFADGKLKRLDLADGIVRVVCDAPFGRGGAWSPNGFIVFAPAAVGALLQVPDAGGTPTPFTTIASPGETQRLPHFLPGGRRILHFSAFRSPRGVYTFDPDTKASKLVLESATEAIYVEPGYLAFVRDENLMLQPFDTSRLELTGVAQPITDGVSFDVNRYFLNLDMAASGALIYQPAQRAPRGQLMWLDRSSQAMPLSLPPAVVVTADIAADGRRAVVDLLGNHGENSLAVIDLDRGILTPFGPRAFSEAPRWRPDGQTVSYATQDADGSQLALAPAEPGAPQRLLTSGPGQEYDGGSSLPDGRLVFSRRKNTDKLGQLMVLDPAVETAPRPLFTSPDSQLSPLLAPGGQLVAYVLGDLDVNERQGELAVMRFPDASARAQVTAGGFISGWGWLGPRELYWVDPGRRAWSATISMSDGRLDVSPSRPLFGGRPIDENTDVLTYSASRDRFLVSRTLEIPSAATLVVASDWRTSQIKK